MNKGLKIAGLVVGVAGALAGTGAAVYGKYDNIKKTAQVMSLEYIAEKNNLPVEGLTEVSTVFQPKTQTFIVEVLNVLENKSHWVQIKLNLKKEVTHIIEFHKNTPVRVQEPVEVEEKEEAEAETEETAYISLNN